MPSIKEFLGKEHDRLTKIKNGFEKEKATALAMVSDDLSTLTSITKYMWDQTSEYIKIYIELDKNDNIPEDSLHFLPTSDTSFICKFGKYKFVLTRLFKSVDMERSAEKGVRVTKSNRVIITLYKLVPDHWSSLQVKESAFKESIAKDTEVDPGTSLMKLMKTMYDEGLYTAQCALLFVQTLIA